MGSHNSSQTKQWSGHTLVENCSAGLSVKLNRYAARSKASSSRHGSALCICCTVLYQIRTSTSSEWESLGLQMMVPLTFNQFKLSLLMSIELSLPLFHEKVDKVFLDAWKGALENWEWVWQVYIIEIPISDKSAEIFCDTIEANFIQIPVNGRNKIEI